MVELCLSYEKVMGVMGVMEKRVKAIIEVTTQGFIGVTIAISGISNGYIVGKVHSQWVHYGKTCIRGSTIHWKLQSQGDGKSIQHTT